jgi:hypothetical protein
MRVTSACDYVDVDPVPISHLSADHSSTWSRSATRCVTPPPAARAGRWLARHRQSRSSSPVPAEPATEILAKIVACWGDSSGGPVQAAREGDVYTL